MTAPVAAQSAIPIRLFFRGEFPRDVDSCVALHNTRDGGKQKSTEVFRTEVINGSSTPDWTGSVELDFLFEAKQEYVVSMKGSVGGSASFALGQVMSSRKHVLTLPLGEDDGKIIITAQERSQDRHDRLEISLAAAGLKKMDLFGLSDPYVKVHRLLPDGSRKLLRTTEHKPKTLDPTWEPMILELDELAGADLSEKTIAIELYDKDMIKKDDYMGEVITSVNDLKSGEHVAVFKPYKPGRTGYGHIFASSVKVRHTATFAEFLKCGFQINLAVSVDFTGSNGDPRNPRSLHYMDPVKPNEYVQAIASVGEVLMEYDTDKMVPAYGFGATLPDQPTVPTHFFPLNMEENAYVHGVQGVLSAYGHALSTVRLASPTNFCPTITNVTAAARSAPNVYTVLLILTDGDITDIEDTKDALVAADDAPLSVVIVGIGRECDFAAMSVLDGDIQALVNTKDTETRRDLVQFVPYRDFVDQPPGALAAEVLREIPSQFTRWAEITKVEPDWAALM